MNELCGKLVLAMCRERDQMLPVFFFITTVLMLIGLGIAIYGRSSQCLIFVRAIGYLMGSAVVNAFLMLTLVALFGSLLLLIPSSLWGEDLLDDTASTFSTGVGKFRAGTFLLMALSLMMAAALIQIYLHRAVSKRFPSLRVSAKTYQIAEYIIQWTTIFLAVYQFFFNGLRELVTSIWSQTEASYMFKIVLAPENINLILQPVLFSTWIMVVVESLNARRQANMEKDAERAEYSSGQLDTPGKEVHARK